MNNGKIFGPLIAVSAIGIVAGILVLIFGDHARGIGGLMILAFGLLGTFTGRQARKFVERNQQD